MKRLLILAVLGAFLIGACGDSNDDGDATVEATTTAAPTDAPAVGTTEVPATATEEATTEAPAVRPATPARAALDQGYNTVPGGAFDAETMGFDSGDVEAQWYQAEGFYVVVYEGLDLEATGPLCPGNSIQTATGFEFISNAPTDGADCSSFPTLSSDAEVGVRVCQGVASYRTAIPADTQGALFGTIERPVDGGIMGITGVAQTAAGIPEIDLTSLRC